MCGERFQVGTKAQGLIVDAVSYKWIKRKDMDMDMVVRGNEGAAIER